MTGTHPAEAPDPAGGPAPADRPAAGDRETAARETAGAGIVKASWAGTALFAATAGLAAVVPEADVAALFVALVLFTGGTAAFAAALVRAAARSRREEVGLGGLFFLEGAAKATRRLVLGSLAVEVVVAFVTAAARPNTSLAFGILAPMWGQGLAALWGARHGAYPPRRARPRPPPAPRAPMGAASGTSSDPEPEPFPGPDPGRDRPRY